MFRKTMLKAWWAILFLLTMAPAGLAMPPISSDIPLPICRIEYGQVPPTDRTIEYIDPQVYGGELYYVNSVYPHFHLLLGSDTYGLNPVLDEATSQLDRCIPRTLLPLEPGAVLSCGSVRATGYTDPANASANSDSVICPGDTELRLLSLERSVQWQDADCLSMGEKDNGYTIFLAVGQNIKLSLSGNPTTGYTWQYATSPSSVILNALSEDYWSDEPIMTGSGGTYTWTYNAAAAGETSLSLEYLRDWEQDTDPLQSFTLNVKVVSALPPEMPNMDGVSYKLNDDTITLYWGEKTSSGYKIKIENATAAGNTLNVDYSLHYPAQDEVTLPVLTYPQYTAFLPLPMEYGNVYLKKAPAPTWETRQQSNTINSYSTDKVWIIRFSTPLNMNSINDQNIYVDNGQGRYQITLEQIDANTIEVRPDPGYQPGSYVLWIDTDILDKKGNHLKSGLRFPFNIK